MVDDPENIGLDEGGVCLETGLGQSVKKIYDGVLFKALKEYAPLLQPKWQENTASRTSRLDVIRSLDIRIAECEADRSTQLELIHNLESKLIEKDETIKKILTSLSWKITAPLRWLASPMRRRGK